MNINTLDREPVYKKKKGIVLFRQVDNLLYISGHGPEDQITGKPIYEGRVGKEYSLEEGYAAARECGIIMLGAIRDILGNLDRVLRIVKVYTQVNADNGFSDIDKVTDGFSDVMAEVFEERGIHARTVVGVQNMPNNNIPVEVEIIVQVR